jgi:hypothetical protein
MLWHLKILFKLIKYLIEYLNWEHEPKVHIYNTLSWLNAPTYEISVTYLERQKSYGLDKLRWEGVEEAEAEEKIRLKQYVSLRWKGRHNKIEENHVWFTCHFP